MLSSEERAGGQRNLFMWLSPWLKTLFLVFSAAHKKAFAEQGWKHTGICGTSDIFVLKISCRDRVHRKRAAWSASKSRWSCFFDPVVPRYFFCRAAQILQFFFLPPFLTIRNSLTGMVEVSRYHQDVLRCYSCVSAPKMAITGWQFCRGRVRSHWRNVVLNSPGLFWRRALLCRKFWDACSILPAWLNNITH